MQRWPGPCSAVVWRGGGPGSRMLCEPAHGETWQNLTGQTPEQSAGLGWLRAVHAEDLEAVTAALEAGTARGHRQVECRVRRADGQWRRMQVHTEALVRPDSGAPEWLTVHRDVTELREAQESSSRNAQALADLSERYLLATRATSDGLWDYSDYTKQIYFSARWQGILGYPEEEYSGGLEHWTERMHPKDLERFRSDIQAHEEQPAGFYEDEYRLQHADGSWRWIRVRARTVKDETSNKLLRVVGTINDVTVRRLTDPLTGLHNRFSLLEELETRLERSQVDKRSFAVLFIDFDAFKRINDNFGHWHGDRVLVEFARRIEKSLEPRPGAGSLAHPPAGGGSLAARLGGDEFVVLLDNAEQEDAAAYAARLHRLLESPVHCGEQDLILSASVGIAMGLSGYVKAEDLLQDADLAMYRAKAGGKAQSCFFSSSMKDAVRARMQVEVDLRRAVERHDAQELFMVYQPKVLLSTGAIIGYEALVRWKHPTRGLVPPDEFIPVAEESDLILSLGRWTLKEAIRQLAEWRRAGEVTSLTTVAVNLSARQFSDTGLVENIREFLAAEQLPPSCLELEVTERVLIDDTSAALYTLRELKAIGIGLELDDFGMGYSSLSYLHRFPFDALKLDRSFVNCLTEEEDSAAIARTVIALGDALKMEVLAEGIETAEQAQRLASMGCLYGQGYFFSRPLAPDQCVRLAASPEHPRKGLVLLPPANSSRNGRRTPQSADASHQPAAFLPAL